MAPNRWPVCLASGSFAPGRGGQLLTPGPWNASRRAMEAELVHDPRHLRSARGSGADQLARTSRSPVVRIFNRARTHGAITVD